MISKDLLKQISERSIPEEGVRRLPETQSRSTNLDRSIETGDFRY